MRETVLDKVIYRNRKRGKQIIKDVVIPRIENSWWQMGMEGAKGRYCPITALRLGPPGSYFALSRMDRAARKRGYKNISHLNDSVNKVEEVIEALEDAAN